MADHYQLNLGSLRSSITLTLHTHHAARLWQGRSRREGVHPILGMPGYIAVTNLLKQASSQDDPYADWFMLQLEEKLLQTKAEVRNLVHQVSQVERDLPTQVDVGDNLNIHPVTLPLYIGSQLGFLAVYLLTDYDTLVRRVLLAHHTALIGRVDMESWIDGGAHHLRSLLGLAQNYRLAGVTGVIWPLTTPGPVKPREVWHAALGYSGRHPPLPVRASDCAHQRGLSN